MPRFGDELARILGKGGTPTAGELNYLRLEGNSLMQAASMSRAWSEPGGSLAPRTFYADAPEFGMNPLDALSLHRDADQTLATGVQTAVSFDKVWANHSKTMRWDTTAPTKLVYLAGGKREHVYAFIGAAVFDTNATGNRSVILAERNAAGGLLQGDTMITASAVNGLETSVPFAIGRVALAGADHFTVEVLQSSGGDLHLQHLSLTVFRLW